MMKDEKSFRRENRRNKQNKSPCTYNIYSLTKMIKNKNPFKRKQDLASLFNSESISWLVDLSL